MSLGNITFDTTKVRLQALRSREGVIFNVTPELIESRTISYKTMDPVHMPGQIVSYEKTTNRTFSLTVKIISRTLKEASLNLNKLTLIKSWAMNHYGVEENINIYGPLGAPPEVLYLSAYAKESTKQNLYQIPTVLISISNTYPSDVDYIETGEILENGTIEKTGIPFPTFMTIELSLLEVHSPKDFSKFSLSKFKQGKLTNF